MNTAIETTTIKHTSRSETDNIEEYYTSADLIAMGWTRHTSYSRIGEPDHWTRNGWAHVALWSKRRLVGMVPPAPPVRRPAQEVDLLSAIFAVNRASKRYRDTAEQLYQSGKHAGRNWNRRSNKPGCFTLSRAASEKKKRLYTLKDNGIAEAYHQSRITYQGRHGRLAIYRGGGYVFHSTIEPSDVDVIECPDQEYIKVEAKPKSSKECRLIDAEVTLDSLENVEDRMEVLPAPDGDGEYARWFERIDAPSIAVNKTPDRNQHKDEEDEEDC